MSVNKIAIYISIVSICISVFLYFSYIKGQFIAVENSPNQDYAIHYYRVFNPFTIDWTTPGNQACKKRWIRLYTKSGHKLKEKLGTDCEVENRVYWFEDKVVLADGETIWQLPSRR